MKPGYLIGVILLFTTLNAQDVREEKIKEAVNAFVKVMQEHHAKESAIKIVPLLHYTALNKSRDALNPNLLKYTFEKIHRGVQQVAYPVKVTKTEKMIPFGRTKTYGGLEYKLWLRKNPSYEVDTVPVGVIWSEKKEEAKIYYMGGFGK